MERVTLQSQIEQQAPLHAKRVQGMALATLLLTSLLLTACTPRALSVQHEYLDRRYLASSYAETIDPRQCGYCGEMLIVRWKLPSCAERKLLLTLRFHNQETEEIIIPLKKRSGSYCYRLMNPQWACKGGVLTYKVEVKCGEETCETFEHQVWTERIEVAV